MKLQAWLLYLAGARGKFYLLLSCTNVCVQYLKYNNNIDKSSLSKKYFKFIKLFSNPGGGKDRVELFIERARKNIVAARDSLATVINILDLKS